MQATVSRETAQPRPLQNASSKIAIAFFSTRLEAQQAVDHLNHSGLRLHQMEIINDAPNILESTDRPNAGRAALQGLIDGATLGLFVSVGIGLLNVSQPLRAMMSIVWPGALGGAVIGLGIGLVSHAFGARQGAIAAPSRSSRYVVMVEADLSREASRMLEGPY